MRSERASGPRRDAARHRHQPDDGAPPGAGLCGSGRKITVAVPGIDRVCPPPRDRNGTVSLLSVGSLVPRKGYDVLLDALAHVADLAWHLTIVGDRDPQRRPAAEKIEQRVSVLKLSRRVTLAGAVPTERLADLYAQADLFVLASRHEGYGMAFAEAIAHGVPVIGTTAGAIPETVPADAGVLVPPDDAAALAAALRRLIGNGEATSSSRRPVPRPPPRCLPTWAQSAQRFAAVLEAMTMTFSADWLALREPYDARARNRQVLASVAAAFSDQSAIIVVDLACGTGSTLRALAGHLPPRQNWRLCDNDLGLLGAPPRRSSAEPGSAS